MILHVSPISNATWQRLFPSLPHKRSFVSHVFPPIHVSKSILDFLAVSLSLRNYHNSTRNLTFPWKLYQWCVTHPNVLNLYISTSFGNPTMQETPFCWPVSQRSPSPWAVQCFSVLALQAVHLCLQMFSCLCPRQWVVFPQRRSLSRILSRSLKMVSFQQCPLSLV